VFYSVLSDFENQEIQTEALLIISKLIREPDGINQLLHNNQLISAIIDHVVGKGIETGYLAIQILLMIYKKEKRALKKDQKDSLMAKVS
jgi:hypothetical protein